MNPEVLKRSKFTTIYFNEAETQDSFSPITSLSDILKQSQDLISTKMATISPLKISVFENAT